MWKKKSNIALLIMAGISELTLAILYHMGIVENGWRWILIAAAIWGILIITVNAMTNCAKACLYGVIVFAVTSGLGQMFLMTGYAATYVYMQSQNLRAISAVVGGSEDATGSHTKLMSYQGYDYYVDSGYTYMYKIKENGLLSEIAASTIYIAADVESVFSENFGEFYTLSNKEAFTDLGSNSLSISFVRNSIDASAFIKIVSDQNKVFYTYFTLDDPAQMIKDLGIVSESYAIGSTNIYLTSASKIVNGTKSGENEILDYEDGRQYILTATGNVYLSEAVAISYGDEIGYSDRVNYFIYNKEITEIEEYRSALNNLDPESDEYAEIQTYIDTLETRMPVMACEMVHETISSGNSIRLYRIRDYSETLQTTPSITIVEIERDGYYIYGYTDLELDDLF